MKHTQEQVNRIVQREPQHDIIIGALVTMATVGVLIKKLF